MTTPRVARSVDDLRVGQHVLVYWPDYRPEEPMLATTGVVFKPPITPGLGVRYDESKRGWDSLTLSFERMVVVIVADPPAPPAADWLVPAEAMEALRESWQERVLPTTLGDAVRAVLDAATEVER